MKRNSSKQDAILEMAKVGLISDILSVYEYHREDQDLDEEIVNALRDLARPQEDVTYTVPDTFRSWGLNLDDYLPIEWATGAYNDVDSRLRELGTSFDELEEMDSEFPFLAAMQSMGSGVGISESEVISDFLESLGMPGDFDLTGYGEGPYNEATEAFDDLVAVIDSELD